MGLLEDPFEYMKEYNKLKNQSTWRCDNLYMNNKNRMEGKIQNYKEFITKSKYMILLVMYSN
jgi:hypothetical protein